MCGASEQEIAILSSVVDARRLGGATLVQGAVAARAQEGLEDLSHIEGQEGQR